MCPLLFVPQGTNIFIYTEGGANIFTHRGGDNPFLLDVDGEKEEGGSEANILASAASKLSAGARILGAVGP